jgi:hypothetical protein
MGRVVEDPRAVGPEDGGGEQVKQPLRSSIGVLPRGAAPRVCGEGLRAVMRS